MVTTMKQMSLDDNKLSACGTRVSEIESTSCSVANVHVTRVLSVDWMVQPNHGQQAIFKNSVLTQAIHLYRNLQMDRLTGNYDVIYRACTMTDREGQRD